MCTVYGLYLPLSTLPFYGTCGATARPSLAALVFGQLESVYMSVMPHPNRAKKDEFSWCQSKHGFFYMQHISFLSFPNKLFKWSIVKGEYPEQKKTAYDKYPNKAWKENHQILVNFQAVESNPSCKNTLSCRALRAEDNLRLLVCSSETGKIPAKEKKSVS